MQAISPTTLKEKYPIDEIKARLREEKIVTIPNLVSTIRVCILPILAYFLIRLSQDRSNFFTYLPVFFVLTSIYVSDYFDGFLARKLNMISIIGQYLDPVCDKIVSIVGFLLLSLYFGFPFWVVVFLFFREVIGALVGYFLFYHRGMMGSPNLWGRMGIFFVASNLYLWPLFPIMETFFQVKLIPVVSYIPLLLFLTVQILGIIQYARDYIPIYRGT